MAGQEKVFRVSVATTDVQAFLEACEASEWYAFDTGERVMTDDGPDAESVLLVEPAATMRTHVASALMH